MTTDNSRLRSPNHLEASFYREMLAPLRDFAASSLHDPIMKRQVRLMTQRFKKEIARYGYVHTERGVMMQVEPDILDSKLTAAEREMLAVDMELLRRLTDKP